MHLDDGKIQSLLHDELDAIERQELDRHLSGCAECRRRLDQARREEQRVFELLGELDRPRPLVHDAGETVHVADLRSAPAVSAGMVAARAQRQRLEMWSRAAAVLIVMGAAGVAYSLPGSPLRAWMDRAIERIAPARLGGPAQPSRSIETPTSGIAVPVAERYTIRFSAPQAQGVVRVTLTDGPEIVVRAVRGTAAFTADAERLVIDNRRSSANYEIELPVAAPWVEVRVGERRLALKQGRRLVTEVAPDAAGGYVLSLAP